MAGGDLLARLKAHIASEGALLPAQAEAVFSDAALTLAGAREPGAASTNGPRQLVYGDVVNGAIDDDTTSQMYTFTGSVGERIQITMKASPGSGLDGYPELQEASGAVIDANKDNVPRPVRDSRIATELPADGSYVIIASRYVGAGMPGGCI